MTRQIVPAYVEIGKGNWVRVGQAAVDISMGSADITLDDDAPIADALKAMMASRVVPGISIGFGTEETNPEDLKLHDEKPFVFKGAEELAEHMQRLRDITKTDDNDAPEMTTGRKPVPNVNIEFKDNLYSPRPGSPYGLSDEQLIAQMRRSSAIRNNRLLG